jgi:TolA-binding protein
MRKRLSLVLSLFVLLTVLGCKMPSSTAGSGAGEESAASTTSSSGESEAERTRRIDEKAAEIARMEEDLRNMQGTDQEKIDAMNRIEQARRELMEMQEGGSNP